MSAKSERRVVEWELLPAKMEANRAPAQVEIEAVDAAEELMPQPGAKTEIVIVVDPGKLAKAASVASVPIGVTVVAVVYFETIILVLKWLVLGAACLAGVVVAVVLLANAMKAATTRQRQETKHPGWSTGARQETKTTTTIIQNAETIINNFYN